MRRKELIQAAEHLAGLYPLPTPEHMARQNQGASLGHESGESIDFRDFREYQLGDDIRRVDWRAFARSGQMYLKLFQKETSPIVEITLDVSVSMGIHQGKEEAAIFLAMFLAETVRYAEGRPALSINGIRYVGRDIEAALLECRLDAQEEADTVARGSSRLASKNTGARPLRMWISDFLRVDGIAEDFRMMALEAVLFMPIMLLSKSERIPDCKGRYRLTCSEFPKKRMDMTITQDDIEEYKHRLTRHETELEENARRYGAELLRITCPDDSLVKVDCERIAKEIARQSVS